MIVRGYFVRGAPYFPVYLHTASFHGAVLLLADTGASRTVILDRDARALAIPAHALTPAPRSIVGVGGSVRSSVVLNVRITLASDMGDFVVRQDLSVIQHDFRSLSPAEAGRILRLPSVMGRDLINQFQLLCDYPSRLLELRQP